MPRSLTSACAEREWLVRYTSLFLPPYAGLTRATVHVLVANSAGFIDTFANSVGLERLGYKYYFVFVGWNVCASVLWFLFCVETRGRTLEELDEVFDQPWPAMASAHKHRVAVKTTEGGRELVEVIDK